MIDINLPVSRLPAIGSAYTEKLSRLNIFTIKDLLLHFPVRYQDLSETITIDQLKVGETVTISGVFTSINSRRISGGRNIQAATFSDLTGNIQITWFNQPFLTKAIKKDIEYNLSGKVVSFRGQPTLTSPQYEPLNQTNKSTIHTAGLIPQYRQTLGVSSKWLRRQLHQLLNQEDVFFEDPLPQNILRQQNLTNYTSSLKSIHFPQTSQDITNSQKRLGFQEMLIYQLVSKQLKNEWTSHNRAYALKKSEKTIKDFIQHLPFSLTSGQSQSYQEILSDMGKEVPMHRLLQGDVGSGKTVVAAIAALQSTSNHHPVLYMAPTEVLAQQHFQTFSQLFSHTDITIGLHTSSQKQKHIDTDITIGTHALLHRQLPKSVGLVIIDEQHRFGVMQRSKLLDQSITPHLLTMTATPIPRTIALTLYSQLDISSIRELPPGRTPVTTRVVSPTKKTQAFHWITRQIEENQAQVFYVCPLIETSTTPKLDQVKAVETEYQLLSQKVFPQFEVGLLHGRMKSKEKDQVLQKFHQGDIDILVSTPVIEVGVDIKNATIMVIESAERFGLASLHQLRGRVGRSDKKSYCLLFPSTNSVDTKRLEYLESTHLGLELAQKDLDIRGPGHLFGTQQSGYIDLKIASLTDLDLIQKTHQVASSIDLDKNPLLAAEVKSVLENLSQAD